MAYNPEYARWYYQNYRKKGLLKGRKPSASSGGKKKSPGKKLSAETKAQIKAPITEKYDAEKDRIRMDIARQRERLRETLRQQTDAIRARIKELKDSGDDAAIERLKQKISQIRLKGAELRIAISAQSRKRIKEVSEKAKAEYKEALQKYEGGGG